MFSIELRPHVGDVEQIFISAHPVTGKGPCRVGYINRTARNWSLINTHGLSDEHQEALASLLQTELMVCEKADDVRKELGLATDERADSSGDGRKTDDGAVS